jgi:DegV family protein with EDD domain
MVEAAVKAAAAGATRQEIADRIEGLKDKMHIWFVVDTLEYLAKGGRIGNAKAFLGTVLKVKPILALQDGAIEPLEQVRSKRKAVARMLELVEDYLGDKCAQATVAVTHALVEEEAKALAQEIRDRLGCGEPIVSNLGPVLGTHTGPGVLGIATFR